MKTKNLFKILTTMLCTVLLISCSKDDPLNVIPNDQNFNVGMATYNFTISGADVNQTFSRTLNTDFSSIYVEQEADERAVVVIITDDDHGITFNFAMLFMEGTTQPYPIDQEADFSSSGTFLLTIDGIERTFLMETGTFNLTNFQNHPEATPFIYTGLADVTFSFEGQLLEIPSGALSNISGNINIVVPR